MFSDYQALMRIWTHPWALKLESARQIERFIDSDDSLKDFVVGTDEEESEASEEMSWTSDESDNGKCFSFHFSRTNNLCTSFIHIFEGEICLRYVSIDRKSPVLDKRYAWTSFVQLTKAIEPVQLSSYSGWIKYII